MGQATKKSKDQPDLILHKIPKFINLTQDWKWKNSNSTKTRISFTHTSLVIFSSDRGQDKLHVLANFATNHQLSFA